jgi:type IV pilus assembly protein PilA
MNSQFLLFILRKTMKNYLQQGFSLIELMIVVAIIGILSMLAIPSYQSYTTRARFSEVITATDPFKTAIALALQQGIALSELTNGSNGIPTEPPSTKNLQSLSVKNGIINAISTKIAGEATLILTPNTDGSSWLIEGSCITLGLCNV